MQISRRDVLGAGATATKRQIDTWGGLAFA
jgi:hypothetical protein